MNEVHTALQVDFGSPNAPSVNQIEELRLEKNNQKATTVAILAAVFCTVFSVL